MAVAERLFARKGLDGVSVRDITTAARANVAAIHYHFGSRRGLVLALLAARAADLGDRRARLLERIESRPDPSLREVVAALVLPTAALAADRRRGGQHYVGFVAAVASHPEFVPLLVDIYEPHTSRYRVALERVTPHLGADERELRWALAKDLVNRTLGTRNGPVHYWLERFAPASRDELALRLIDFLTGAFAVPSP